MSDFTKLSEQFWRFFKDGMEIVIATSSNNNVTARTVSTVALGGKLYFITMDSTVKYGQIKENPNVALCHNDVQLRGTAAVLPVADNGAAFKKVISTFSEAEGFSKLPGTVMIEVTPETGSFGRAEALYALDFKNQTAHRITFMP